jgi:acetoin utilization protein AcuC
MHDYPVLATGATLAGAQAILSGDARVAFNPSGGFHHAGPDRASGFCYINDVVVACMVLAETGRRVAFVDLDVHHCDGVQAAFYRRRDVLTLSLHESGATLFPGTGFEEEIGEGPGRGYAVNVPLPVGTDDQAYLRAFREIGLPVLHACEPDVIVLELGMDGLMGDPLAHLHLTNNAYADAVGWVLHLGKPVLAVGGGGYNVENTARGWALMWSVLCGDSSADMAIGLGGVLLESAEWGGGLRDRVLASHGGQRDAVDRAIEATIRKLKSILFPIHRL